MTVHCTTHGDLMAMVNFPTHGNLEIPAELTFIHPLEAKEHWTSTGPGFTLGDKITTLDGQAIFGVVHGFVTQSDSSPVVLIWFNETDKYMQLRPDHIQLDNTALSSAKLSDQPQEHLNTGQTCLSGCTLLANPSGGIQMREVRPGTFLLNAKGKKVRVTNVYFSRESTVMVQISAQCHATITHPMVDTKGHRRWCRGRRISAKTIVTAAEWYTRRRHNIYRSTPMGSPPCQPLEHQVGHLLHLSSPQNLRKSGDMWGFSTEHNQPVRSFDDPSCLICPIGHIGWAQVDIATAILGCWGRTRHLPDPRPDLTEFQEQTEAIHAFLSSPEAVRTLERSHMTIPPDALFPRDKHPIEFTNGHIQLEWVRGRWSVQKWKDMETSQPLWIQPEENFLSALIRPPSRPEPIAPEYTLVAKLDRSTRNSSGPPDRPPQDNLQEQALARQEWPHPNTTTMVLYMQKMKWRTRIHAEITLHKHTMDNGQILT